LQGKGCTKKEAEHKAAAAALSSFRDCDARLLWPAMVLPPAPEYMRGDWLATTVEKVGVM